MEKRQIKYDEIRSYAAENTAQQVANRKSGSVEEAGGRYAQDRNKVRLNHGAAVDREARRLLRRADRDGIEIV